MTKPTGVDLDDLMATWYTYCRSAGAVVLVETTAEVTSTARVLLGHLRNVLAIDLASLCSDDLVHGPRPLRPDLAEHLMAHCGGDPFAIDQTFRSMQRNRTVQYNRRTGQWEIISESPTFKRRPSVTAATISAPDGTCDDTRIRQQLDDPAIVIDLTKIDGALRQLDPVLGESEPGPQRDALVAALHGVLGDHLSKTENPLAIPMTLRSDGQAIPRDAEALRALLPNAGKRILVMVHGGDHQQENEEQRLHRFLRGFHDMA